MRGKVILGDSRRMPEVADASVDLVVTSPPYWHIKDYGVPGQIGYGQTLHNYLRDLYRVWKECHRVLRDGGRLCVNVGDQFARATIYGRYRVIPIHAEVISQAERLGFDFMGSIIWQKKTRIETSGGANVMGSYPYPSNGIVELDYEFIHIFKKPGKSKRVALEVKQASKLSKEEWKEFFSGHWRLGGARQLGHEAMFPEELPRRLIRMFTFVGGTVLDPFLGSGTTLRVALELRRNAVGYEINREFVGLVKEKVGPKKGAGKSFGGIAFERRSRVATPSTPIDYVPGICDAKPGAAGSGRKADAREALDKVVEIVSEDTLRLETGNLVSLLGIKVDRPEETIAYLKTYVLGKRVLVKFDSGVAPAGEVPRAYVYLKNRIFVNGFLVKSGLASPDNSVHHRLSGKLSQLREQAKRRK